MPVSQVLNLYEGNTDTVTLAFTQQATTVPENLTGVTVEVYFKASASIADDDASVTVLTSPLGVEVTNATGGLAQFVVPPEVVASPGSTFWRCDLVVGDSRRTAAYGAVVTENL